jgi:hypothetical protein
VLLHHACTCNGVLQSSSPAHCNDGLGHEVLLRLGDRCTFAYEAGGQARSCGMENGVALGLYKSVRLIPSLLFLGTHLVVRVFPLKNVRGVWSFKCHPLPAYGFDCSVANLSSYVRDSLSRSQHRWRVALDPTFACLAYRNMVGVAVNEEKFLLRSSLTAYKELSSCGTSAGACHL